MTSRRWVRLLLGSAAVCLALLGGELALRRAVPPDRVVLGEGCATVEGLAADVGSFPLLLRLLRGRTGALEVTARRVEIGEVRGGPLRARIGDVAIRPWQGLHRVRLSDATIEVRIPLSALERQARPARIEREGRLLIVRDLLPVPIRLELAAHDGAVRLAAPPGAPVPLDLSIRIPRLHVSHVGLDGRSVEVRARATGDVDGLACAARDAVEEQLQLLRVLGR